jgi:hypothetical protein
MQTVPLKFKVDDGLGKIAALYESLDTMPDALETCWNQPEILMQNMLQNRPAHDIHLSGGYKKLADSLSTLDLNAWCQSFAFSTSGDLPSIDLNALAALKDAICPGEEGISPLMAMKNVGGVQVSTSVMVTIVTVAIVVAVASLSGNPTITPDNTPKPPSLGLEKSRLKQLSAHAQSIADQLGWFSR